MLSYTMNAFVFHLSGGSLRIWICDYKIYGTKKHFKMLNCWYQSIAISLIKIIFCLALFKLSYHFTCKKLNFLLNKLVKGAAKTDNMITLYSSEDFQAVRLRHSKLSIEINCP